MPVRRSARLAGTLPISDWFARVFTRCERLEPEPGTGFFVGPMIGAYWRSEPQAGRRALPEFLDETTTHFARTFDEVNATH